MSNLWSDLENLSSQIQNLFDKNFTRKKYDDFPFHFDGWEDHFWFSDDVRKCHLKIIDNRESRKLWLMHINIFPQTNINLPILGFDLVAGPRKITGAFFDYSPIFKHPYMDYLEMRTKNLSWSKPRELPDWAKEIFSQNMIAAGNISCDKEIKELCNVTLDLTQYYVENLNKNAFRMNLDLKYYSNRYCVNQKKNVHLHRSILAAGISESDKNKYVNEILFEEI